MDHFDRKIVERGIVDTARGSDRKPVLLAPHEARYLADLLTATNGAEDTGLSSTQKVFLVDQIAAIKRHEISTSSMTARLRDAQAGRPAPTSGSSDYWKR